MIRLIVTWEDVDELYDDVYDESFDCDSIDEAKKLLDECDMKQYNGHEIVKFHIYS